VKFAEIFSRARKKPSRREVRAGGGTAGAVSKGSRALDGSEVRCYSGYKGGETPRAVFLENSWVGIREILERKRARDIRSGTEREAFLCRLETGDDILLESRKDGRWAISWKT
jgi:hypothetical protein